MDLPSTHSILIRARIDHLRVPLLQETIMQDPFNDIRSVNQIVIDQLTVIKSTSDEKVAKRVTIELTKKGIYLGPNYKLNWNDLDKSNLEDQRSLVKKALEENFRQLKLFVKPNNHSKPKFILLVCGANSLRSFDRFFCQVYDKYQSWLGTYSEPTDDDAPFELNSQKSVKLPSWSQTQSLSRRPPGSTNTLQRSSKRQKSSYGPRSKLEKLKQKILTRSIFQDDEEDGEIEENTGYNSMDIPSQSLTNDGHYLEDQKDRDAFPEAADSTNINDLDKQKYRLKRMDKRRSLVDDEEDVDFGESTTMIPSKRLFSVIEDDEDETERLTDSLTRSNNEQENATSSYHKALVTPITSVKSDPGSSKQDQNKTTPTQNSAAQAKNTVSTIRKFFLTQTASYKKSNEAAIKLLSSPMNLKRYASPIRTPQPINHTSLTTPREATTDAHIYSSYKSINNDLSPKFSELTGDIMENRLATSQGRSPMNHTSFSTPTRATLNHYSTDNWRNANTSQKFSQLAGATVESTTLDGRSHGIPPFKQYIGLKNLGNTCYLNSAIQMLFSVEPFIIAMDEFYKRIPSSGQNLPLSLLSNVLNLAKRMRILHPSLPESNIADPSSLKRAIDQVTDQFKGFEQRDSHEFAATFIDLLHEEFSAINHYDTEDPTDIFLSKVQVSLKCDSCGYSRSRVERYRHLSLQIGTNCSLRCFSIKDALCSFFSNDKVEVTCEQCNNGKSATQTMRMISCPKALFLHIKRFTVSYQDRMGTENALLQKISDTNTSSGNTKFSSLPCISKNQEKLLLESELSLEEFQLPSTTHDGETYHLRSVVHHHGSTASSGHYTADSFRSDKWLHLDDGVVKETSMAALIENEQVSGDTYMLMYVKQLK